MIDVYRVHLKKHGYDIGANIGHGAYGQVYLVTCSKYQNQVFACKIMEQRNGDYKERIIMSFEAEVDSLKQLYHPNIVNTYDYFQEEQFLYIISEYCSGGDLMTLTQRKPDIIMANIFKYTEQILSALAFIHSNNIAHLDIKPPNIFLDSYGRLKVADFGLATVCQPGEKRNRICGSALFLPPEMLRKQEYDPFKADVWAFGLTIYFIVTKSIPWANMEVSKALQIIEAFHPDLPKNCHPAVRALINQCLTINPNLRPTIVDIQRNFLNTVKQCRTQVPFAKTIPTLVRPKGKKRRTMSVMLLRNASQQIFHFPEKI